MCCCKVPGPGLVQLLRAVLLVFRQKGSMCNIHDQGFLCSSRMVGGLYSALVLPLHLKQSQTSTDTNFTEGHI